MSADRQFAHLGLMLLGVLAQVDQAVAPFAAGPGDSPDTAEPQGETTAGVQSGRLGGIKGEDTVDRDSDAAMDTEMGVAVSREEVMLSIEQDAASLPAPARPATQPHPRSISLPINPSSKRKLPIQTALSNTEPPSKEGSTNPDSAKPRKQPRKGNDEFDNIFGSSEDDAAPAPTNPPKKKRPRLGNDQKPAASKEPTISITGGPPPDKASLLQKKKKVRENTGGDEFDNIFGSLDDGKSKKPKKKKRKKGDEFDDIFGGL